MAIRVTIFNEFVHERTEEAVRAIYPEGLHKQIANMLMARGEDFEIRFATLEMPENGLTQDVVDNTDVMLWWGHMCHDKVLDEVAERVVTAVQRGMGFIALHSAHFSKPFRSLMGTPCALGWREVAENGRMWIIDRTHPIMEGIGPYIDLDAEEMYCEPFSIPAPDELLGITWWKGGEVLRGACTYKRGFGKVFYFHPGHESLKSYYNEDVIRVIANAIRWAKPVMRVDDVPAPYVFPVEPDIREALFEEKDGVLDRKANYTKPHKWTSIPS